MINIPMLRVVRMFGLGVTYHAYQGFRFNLNKKISDHFVWVRFEYFWSNQHFLEATGWFKPKTKPPRQIRFVQFGDIEYWINKIYILCKRERWDNWKNEIFFFEFDFGKTRINQNWIWLPLVLGPSQGSSELFSVLIWKSILSVRETFEISLLTWSS